MTEPHSFRCEKHRLPALEEGGTCIRCRFPGVKCSVCGSPHLYMMAWKDGEMLQVPYCKPCLYAHMHAEGYFPTVEELQERKDKWVAEQKALKKSDEQKEEEARLALMAGPPQKRKYRKKGDPEPEGPQQRMDM